MARGERGLSPRAAFRGSFRGEPVLDRILDESESLSVVEKDVSEEDIIISGMSSDKEEVEAVEVEPRLLVRCGLSS